MRKLQCAIAAASLVAGVQCGSTSGPATDAEEIPSPSGRIAFVTQAGSFSGALYVANSDGSGLRKIASGAAFYSRPRWSPDRRQIVFSRLTDGGRSHIYVVDVDGKGGIVPLAAGMHPSWSPNGLKIVFANDSVRFGGFGIFTMNADGTGIRRLTSPNNPDQCAVGYSSSDFRPDWSPDGQRILFERQIDLIGKGDFGCGLDGFIPHVWIMNTDGTGARRLTAIGLGNVDAEPAWSPNSRAVAFSNQLGGLFVVDADGSAAERAVATEIGYKAFSPVWSPDGNKLLFVSSAPPNNLLAIHDLGSRSTHFLGFPSEIGAVFDPAWSR